MELARIVYILCALTSLACAGLLIRGYLRSRVRLLLWSSLCFIGLAANNVILFIDLVVLPQHDLALMRNLSSLIGLALLIYGLIWDAR